MSKFDFDLPIDRSSAPHDDSMKWGRYLGRHANGNAILPMWVADMDFAAPTPVLAALNDRLGHGVFGYPRVTPQVRDAVLLHLARDLHWQVDPDWLVWLPGLVTGLNVACRAVGEIGDGVVTAEPIYPPFMSAPRLSDRQLHTVPLTLQDDRPVWDLAALEALADSPAGQRIRLLMLCNPHNPIGRVWQEDELRALAGIAERHGWVICSDDIHCELVLDKTLRYRPLARLDPDIARRTMTLLAPSKTYNIPGLGAAFAVIPDAALRGRFERAMAGIVPHINVLGYTAMAAAYREGVPWRNALLDYLRVNRDLLVAGLGKCPALRVSSPEATYLAWIDARGLNLQDGQTAARFFESEGVGLSPGEDYMPGARDHVRLNFGCTRQTLEEAIYRMAKACG